MLALPMLGFRKSTAIWMHSLRPTMLTRLGEAGVAFTIMRIAGHSSITVSQRYVHPSNETMERAFERLEALNGRMIERMKPVVHRPTTVSTTLVPVTTEVEKQVQ